MKKMIIINIVLWCLLSLPCAVKCDLNLPEGSPCITDTHNGTCVNLYRCQSTAMSYLYINAGLGHQVPSMPEICSYKNDGEPVVCCTDCTLDPTEKMKSYEVLSGGNFYSKTGSRAWTKCLEYFKTLPYSCRGKTLYRLDNFWDESKMCNDWYFTGYQPGIGGTPAVRGQFPHMALLGYGPDQETAQWLCGGSVISERFILTAAHCSSTPSLGPITYAGLGVLKRTDLAEYWKVYKIKEVIKHPEYKAPSKYHDIALLRTETEINFGKDLLPACLDVGKPWQTSSYHADAPGWGRVGHRNRLADTLQIMTLDEYSEDDCHALFPVHRHLAAGYNHTMQMCYGRRDKVVDTCEGDSGGPLQTDLGDCIYFIFGVTSYGKDCGIPGNAGMYTRVSNYAAWIESIVWPNE